MQDLSLIAQRDSEIEDLRAGLREAQAELESLRRDKQMLLDEIGRHIDTIHARERLLAAVFDWATETRPDVESLDEEEWRRLDAILNRGDNQP